MRIGVISDTHIPDRAKEIPAAVLKAFEKVDMIIHAGDLVKLGVLDKLKAVCSNVKAVWGNMDPEEARKRLPEKEVIQAGNFKIGLIHGWGAPSNLIDLVAGIFKEDKVDVIIFGHGHYAVNEKRNGILYFSPGSPTDKVFSPYNSYGIIEINEGIEAKIIRL